MRQSSVEPEQRLDSSLLPMPKLKQVVKPTKEKIYSTAYYSIKALLIDLSGTLHIGPTAIPGAVHAIERLREAKFPFKFWFVPFCLPHMTMSSDSNRFLSSNTSKESTAALINRLTEAGFTIHPKEVFTSLGAMRELLVARGIERFVLFSRVSLRCI